MIDTTLSTDQITPSCTKCNYNLSGIDLSANCPECGERIINECMFCDYDLSNTDPNNPCPECGVPVLCSIGNSAFASVSTEQLKSVHTGFKLVTMLILLYIVSVIATMVLSFALLTNAPDLNYLFTVVAAVVNNAIIFGIIVGWFKMIQPLKGLPSLIDAPDKRTFVRAMLWVFTGITVITLIYGFIPSAQSDALSVIDIAFGIFYIFSLVFMLALFISNVMYIGWFAKLVRNKKMAKRSKHFVWSGPLIAILGFPLLFLGPLITLVLYWNQIEYIRRDLKKIIQTRHA